MRTQPLDGGASVASQGRPPEPPARATPPRPAAAGYRLTRPHLREWPDEAFDPVFLAASRTGGLEALRAAVRKVHPDVYALTPLAPARVRELSAEIGRFHAWCLATGATPDAPNSMNTYGVTLDTLGIDPTRLLEALAPFATQLFAPMGGDTLDHAHGFVVSYAHGRDVDLGFHADDAEVTLNLCLGEGFAGGALYFEGLRCEAHRQTGCSEADRFIWTHTPGVALLHAGAHRHGALPILSGTRHNLILWMRSAAWRGAAHVECPEWCRESMAR